jgi:dipeptidyl aminopeptidase/acylaminoacyl peptidase
MPFRALTRASLALLLLSSACARASAASPWTYDDSIALRKVHDARVSPDGTRVVYVVSALSADSTQFQTDLWLGTLASGEQRRLTATETNEDVPRWSPDGRAIAFLSDRPAPGAGDGGIQVWSLPLEGGDASALTASPTGVMAYEWSANGAKLAYLAPEGPGEATRARAAAGDDTGIASEPQGFSRVHLLDRATRTATPVSPEHTRVSAFTLSPDGTRLVYAAQDAPGHEGLTSSDLWSVPAAGGAHSAPVPLVRRPGMDLLPHFSPDGRWIAFLSNDGDSTGWVSDVFVCVVPAAGGAARNLTPDFHDIVLGGNADTDPAWAADGKSVLFLASARTAVHAFRAYVEPRSVEAITQGDGVNDVPNSDAAGRVFAWTHEDATHPGEVWVREGTATPARAFTDLNPWTRGKPSFEARVVRWAGADGREVEGLLYLPPGARANARVPLLVYLHGGPAANHAQYFTPTLDMMGRVEFLQEGWAVLMPNPRGSSGYGREWRLASTRDWGGAPADDVLRGVDDLVARGIADSTRLAVCGWSYGGYLTAMLATRTSRFRAAVAGAGPMDLVAMAGTSDIPGFTRFSMGAWPWEDATLYREQSPLSRAHLVRTPLAFAHGERDVRVPVAQSRQMYRAMRTLGVPTDLLTLPREMHIPAEPRHFRTLMRWTHAWIIRWTASDARAR